MIFDEILKDLQKGLHGKVLAEKLFENFSHTEIQPILKEIQKKLIEKNSALKRILSNNYLELLNCSDLIHTLNSYSSAIKSNVSQQKADFSQFQQGKNEENLDFKGKNIKMVSFPQKIDKIALRVTRLQNKGYYILSTILIEKTLQVIYPLYNETMEENNVKSDYWIYNMLKDMKKENFRLILVKISDFLKNEENEENINISNKIQELFWSVFLYFYHEKKGFENVYDGFFNGLKEVSRLVEENISEKRFFVKNIIILLGNIWKMFENGVFEKEMFFFLNLESKPIILLIKCKDFRSFKEENDDNSDINEVIKISEEVKLKCVNVFQAIALNLVRKMLERVELELYDAKSNTINFNFQFLKTLYLSSSVEQLYQDLLIGISHSNLDFSTRALLIWHQFFPEFLKNIDIQLKKLVFELITRFSSIFTKNNEFFHYQDKNYLFLLNDINEKNFTNFLKITDNYQNILSQAKEIPKFYKEIDLEEGFIKAFTQKIRENLKDIHHFLRENSIAFHKNPENSLFLRNFKILMIFMSFLRVSMQKLDGLEVIKNSVFEEFSKEIQILEEEFEEKFKTFIMISLETDGDNNFNVGKPFTEKLDRLINKMNKLISDIEFDKKYLVFSQEFYERITQKLMDGFMEKKHELCKNHDENNNNEHHDEQHNEQNNENHDENHNELLHNENNADDKKLENYEKMLIFSINFIKLYFPIKIHDNIDISNYFTESQKISLDNYCLRYHNFLRKDVRERIYKGIGTLNLKKIKKYDENINFIDNQMNPQLLNFTIIPHFFKTKTMKSPNKQKALKGNQIQQSQTMVSSVVNKDAIDNKEDYLSRMMEGLNNTMKGLGIKERASNLASFSSTLFNKK